MGGHGSQAGRRPGTSLHSEELIQRSPLVPLALAGTVTFTVPAASTLVVVTDLAPSAGYSATASAAGGNLTVTVQPGSGFTTSANGALYVNVSSSGTVTAGN